MCVKENPLTDDFLKKYPATIIFPPANETLVEGIIHVGGDLTVGNLYSAYSQGIFPWPHPGYPMLWFCPEQRGILDFSDFHVSESLRKFKRRHRDWVLTVNKAFPQVIEHCQKQPRPGQEGTWISATIKKAYLDFYNAGCVLSVECWEGEKLIGGIYGVLINGGFAGESMFFKKSNASKISFWFLVEYLQSLGHKWMDMQMVTPVTESFGGKYISRDEFLERLKRNQ